MHNLLKKYLCVFIAFSLGITFFFAGCVTTSVKPTQPELAERTFDAPKNKVWKEMSLILMEVGVTIQTSDKESGIISTSELSIPTGTEANGLKNIAIIPTAHKIMMTMFYEANYRLNIIVIPDNEQRTIVKIKCLIRAKSKGWFDFQSNGKLEQQIFDKIEKRLPARN